MFGDEYREPSNPTGKSMPTDPTEEASITACLTCEEGFTQTWDTVGAGAKSHSERA